MSKYSYFNDKAVPAIQKVASNSYVVGVQKAVLKVVPMILVSSIITLYNIVKTYVSWLPALDPISNYSFGLIGIMTAFLIPYYLLEEKHDSRKIVGGMTGLAVFMLAMNPKILEEGNLYNFSNFGAAGMFVAILCGLFIVMIFRLSNRLNLASEDSPLPDFCKEWFNSIIPIFVILLISTIVVYNFEFDLFNFIVLLCNPILGIVDTYWGGLLIVCLQTVVYTFGISCWVFNGAIWPITTAALAANAAAFAAGTSLPYVYSYGFDYAYIIFGGMGVTLPLAVYFLRSKSKRLKLLGKVYIGPTLLNINEPIMYGNVVWNPILMIPSWLCTIANYSIAYLLVRIGLIMPPISSFGLWFLPYPLPSLLIGGISAAIVCCLLIALDFVIWRPFFKAYEKSILKEEAEAAVAEA